MHGATSAMRRYAPARPGARSFVLTAYRADPSGRVQPDLPTTCPLHQSGEAPCAVGLHHWRHRVHGPGFPLAVARCHRHGRAFTLYPPAWVPYGRCPIANANLDGARVSGWADTLFDTPLAVADGESWAWEIREDNTFVARLAYTTEYSHIDRAARLLGLDDGLDHDRRHHIAETLRVPALLLLGLTAGLTRPRYRARSQAIHQVLGRLPDPPHWQDLLVAGHLAGLWPAPCWCHRGHLVPLAFRAASTPQPTQGKETERRSTTAARDPPARPA